MATRPAVRTSPSRRDLNSLRVAIPVSRCRDMPGREGRHIVARPDQDVIARIMRKLPQRRRLARPARPIDEMEGRVAQQGFDKRLVERMHGEFELRGHAVRHPQHAGPSRTARQTGVIGLSGAVTRRGPSPEQGARKLPEQLAIPAQPRKNIGHSATTGGAEDCSHETHGAG